MDEESQNSVTINDSPANFETTKRELYAWYSYEAGISTVASVGMSFVVPLLLDLIAFNSGSSYPVNDASPSSLPDFSTLPNSNWFNYGTCIAGNTTAYTPSSREYYDICVVPWGGTYIRHTTWALSVISVSVGIQAFCFISLGSLSDHGRLRKFLLLCFTIIQIVAAVGLIIPFTKEWFFGAGVLVVVLNVGIGVSGVITNSYLPIFTKNDPDVIQAFAGVDEKSSWEKYEQARKVSENVANRLSAIGYLSGGISAALFTVIAALFIVFLDQNLGLRLSMLTSGVILFALSLPFWFWVRERPGPPLPKGQIPIVYSWITRT
ncbi:Autophagy protein 22 [Nowakowskiella sp. JEL0407]|nr:Autophagy protein 22 [Nowakowskiella sp. JEL0407]